MMISYLLNYSNTDVVCFLCVVGARDAELLEPLSQHVHEGHVSGPDRHAFHVSGCPTGK